ncbi:MAG: hypothetical protein COB02_17925 [Candidatus Cloacimonadota bacterium]|nr:MAG: hypothetical protein COB02_17925 [Candidatus Cloacimonadota bacterium]
MSFTDILHLLKPSMHNGNYVFFGVMIFFLIVNIFQLLNKRKIALNIESLLQKCKSGKKLDDVFENSCLTDFYSAKKICAEGSIDFDYSNSIENYPKSIDLFPNLYISVGILGTFVGIVLGLKGLGNQLGDVEQLSTSIPILLESIYLAFRTSIWGIFLGNVVSFTSNTQDMKIESYLSRIDSHLSIYFASEKKQASQVNQMLRIFEEMKEDKGALSKEVSQTVKEVSIGFSDKLNEFSSFLRQEIQVVIKNIETDKSDKILKELESFTKAFSSQFFHGLDNSREQFTNHLNNNVSSLQESQESMLNIIKNLENSGTLINQQMESQLRQAKEMTNHEESFKSITFGLTQVVNNFNDFQSNYKDVLEGFSRSKNMEQDTISMNQKYLDTIVVENQKIVDKYDKSNGHMSELGNLLSGIQCSFSLYTQKLDESVQLMTQLVDKENYLVEDLASFQQSLRDKFIEMGTISDSLNSVSLSLVDGLKHSKEINSQVSSSLITSVSIAENSRTWLNSAEHLTLRMTNMSEEFSRLYEENKVMVNETTLNFKSLGEDCNTIISKFPDHMETSYLEFDRNMAEICRHLNQTVTLFKNAVKEAEDAFVNISRN